MINKLRCPACVRYKPSKLKKIGNRLICQNNACRNIFKFENHVPILVTNDGDFLKYYTESEKYVRKNKST